MTGEKRIMIGFDFTGVNYPAALYTLQQWATYVAESTQFDVVFGASTSSHRAHGLPSAPGLIVRDALVAMLQYCEHLVCWDEYVSDLANHILKSVVQTEVEPFYEGFNYGSLVNRLLLLAHVAGCDYLVRIDPGTRPPDSRRFDELIAEHIAIIGDTKKVVSRGYEGRLAIRDLFVKDKEKHRKLVQDYTGIDPTQQVTGGAMMTSGVPGVPAMGFQRFGPKPNELTLIWGSDDAIYQMLEQTQGSIKLEEVPISRFDPEGKRKSTIEYYRGIAGMVYLSNLIQGKKYTDAKTKLTKFFEVLKTDHLDPAKYRPEEKGRDMVQEFCLDSVAPDPFLAKIREGFENHQRLIAEGKWIEIANALRARLYPYIQIC